MEKAREKMNAATRGQPQFFEWKHYRYDGTLFDAEVSLNVFNVAGKNYLQGVVHDVTERQRSEEALRTSRLQLLEAMDLAHIVYWEFDPVAQTYTFNDPFYAFYGTTAEQEGGYLMSREDYAKRFIHLDDLPLHRQFVKENTLKPDTELSVDLEHRIIRRNGEVRHILVRVRLIKDDAGRIVKRYGANQDITERKRSEEALRTSRLQLLEAMDLAHIVYWEFDPAAQTYIFNDPFYVFYGTTAEQEGGYLVSREDYAKRFIHPDDIPLYYQFVKENASRPDTELSVDLEHRIIRRNGEVRHILARIRVIKDDAGRIIKRYGSNQDITEHKGARDEREKMLLWQQGVNLLQQSLLAPTTLEEKLRTITDSIVSLFDADFCRIWLIQPGDLCEQGCVHAEVNEGPHICRYRDGCLHLLASSGRYTHTDGKIHRRVPFGCYKIGRIASDEDHKFLTNDVQNDPRVHNNEWARELGLISFVGYQLRVASGKTLGVLALFAKHPISSPEDAILDGLSSTVALVIQRDVAEESLRQTLESLHKAIGTTIQVMVSAVEARDPYTAGHQLRSADLARAIAMEMGLPQEKIDGIRMAGFYP